MKRILLTCICLVVFVSVYAQSIVVQSGVAYRYNGKMPRTPLGNVYLQTSALSSGVLSDSINGKFLLQLQNLQMGSPISNVKVIKKGMIIFNQQTVDEWSVRKAPLCLVLCDADEFEKQKKKLISIGEREAKKRYDRRIKEIEKKYKEESAEWYQKVHEADSALQSMREHMGEYADLFVRIDESEIDTSAQEALDLFRNGKIEESIRKLEAGKYLEKLEKDIKTERQAERLIDTAQVLKERAIKSRRIHVGNINVQIRAYKMQGEWQKAADLMKGLADILNDPHEMFEYAYFCQIKRVNVEDVETYYNKVVSLIEGSKDVTPFNLFVYATTWNNLSEIYSNRGEYSLAEMAAKKGIDGRRQYAEITGDPNNFNHVAWSVVTFADILISQQKFDESEVQLKEAEQIYNQIASTYYEGNEFAYGRLYDKYGWLYLHTQKLEKSEYYYMKAWEKYKISVPHNPVEFVNTLCWILQYGIIELYSSLENKDKCRQYIQELDSILTEQIPAIPNKEITPNIGTCYLIMASEYFKLKLYKKAELANTNAIKIFRILAKESPKSYESYVAMALKELANLYNITQRFTDAEEMYVKSLEIYQRLAKAIPKAYEQNVAVTYGNMSYNALFMKKFSYAEQLAREGLKIDSTQHWIATNFAAALLFQGRYDEAEQIYCQYKEELKDSFLDDFRQFAEAGVIPKEREKDVERIKKILEE